MFLRDLIFGRRPRPAPVSAPPVSDITDEAPAAPGFGEAPVAEFTVPALPAQHEGRRSLSHAAFDMSHASAGEPPPRYPVLGLILGSSMPAADRARAVVDELSRALSLQRVALVGTGRTARLLVANRRILAAQFTGTDAALDLDWRRDPMSEGQALALHAALADLLAAPIDLMVETRPAAGVYAADDGLPVALLAGDDAALRAAFVPPEAEFEAEFEAEPDVEPAEARPTAADPAPVDQPA